MDNNNDLNKKTVKKVKPKKEIKVEKQDEEIKVEKIENIENILNEIQMGTNDFINSDSIPEILKKICIMKNVVLPKQEQPVFICDTTEIEDFYDNNSIVPFLDVNVVYLIAVGKIGDNNVIKYGKSSRFFERDYNEHKLILGKQSKVIWVGKTDNNTKVESLFKKFLETKKCLIELEFKGKNRTELFKTSQILSIDDAIDAMEELIEQNPSDSEKKIQKYEMDKNNKYSKIQGKIEIERCKLNRAKETTKQFDAIEKTKQLQIIENIQKEITKQKKLDLGIFDSDTDEDLDEKNDKNKNVKKYVKKYIKKYVKQDVKQDVNQDVKQDIKQDIKQDVKQDVKQDIKQDVKQDVKQDIYSEFLNEYTQKSNIHISTTEIYNYFKIWLTKNNPKAVIPSNRIFILNIEKYKKVENIKINGNNFYGIKFLGIKLEKNRK